MTQPTPRTPTQAELPRAAEIAQLAFQRLTLDHWLRSYNWIAENHGLDYLVVAEAGGELVSSLLLPMLRERRHAQTDINASEHKFPQQVIYHLTFQSIVRVKVK